MSSKRRKSSSTLKSLPSPSRRRQPKPPCARRRVLSVTSFIPACPTPTTKSVENGCEISLAKLTLCSALRRTTTPSFVHSIPKDRTSRRRRVSTSSRTTKSCSDWIFSKWSEVGLPRVSSFMHLSSVVSGAKVAGHRGFFLTGDGVDLNQAMITYGLDFLRDRGFKKMQPPFFMNKALMGKTAQLEEFDEALYKVRLSTLINFVLILLCRSKETERTTRNTSSPLRNNPSLPSTPTNGSSRPLNNFLKNTLDIRLVSERKLVPVGEMYWGSSGSINSKRLNRSVRSLVSRVVSLIWIFDKFVITDPESSWEMFDTMIANSEDFYQSLGLPYQLISIVSGALNNAAAKKYDLEAWFPHQGVYKELVSVSNCTDYRTSYLLVVEMRR